MKPRLRYGLIVLFFAAFFILTPFIVAFVTGIKYDFSSHGFVKTATISVKTDPKDAQISLNGKAVGAAPATLRFITPGDYQIDISKDGYFDWNKRLAVRAQYVTAINSQDINALVLFHSDPKTSSIQDGVTAMSAGRNKILYLTANQLFFADISTPALAQKLTLPQNFQKIEIVAAADEKHYLLHSANYYAVYDAANNQLHDISALFNNIGISSGSAESQQIQFSSDGNLYLLFESAVYQIDWQNLVFKTALNKVSSFYVNGRAIYYLHPASGGQQLIRADLPSNSGNILIAGLPNWSNSKIYLDGQNQPFILGDAGLYTAANGLRQLADFVSAAQIYNKYGMILYSSANEIDAYDYWNDRTLLITRSSKPIKNPLLFADLGWVFFLNDNRVQAIEIDSRDHQNNYTFAAASDSAQFFMDSAGRNIFLLDRGMLKQINIR